MDLPNKQRTFNFEHVGEDTGKKYEGLFTVLCVLNIGQKHARDLEQTRLLGNHANPTDSLAGFAVILSNLRAKIVDAPEWWKQSAGGSLIEDEDALVLLYKKVEEADALWREELKKKSQSAQTQDTQS